MKKIILPSTRTHKSIIETAQIRKDVFIGTTKGLVKQINEDRLGYLNKDGVLRICIADGHWGDKASKVIVDHLLENELTFPATKQAAFKKVSLIERKLFGLFGSSDMDPNLDFTPEASFISCETDKKNLSIISYGDCRLLVVNKGKVRLKLKTQETWLGAFSHLGLRNRISISKGMLFKKINLLKDDIAFLFTDGIDQCIYEKDTLDDQFLARQAKLINPEKIFKSILKEVFSKGAEDNASLAVLRF